MTLAQSALVRGCWSSDSLVDGMKRTISSIAWVLAAIGLLFAASAGGAAAEDWPQWKFDSGHSGNVPQRRVATPLGLLGAVPLSDAVLTAPAVAGGRVVAVDASGTAFSFDAATLRPLWKHVPEGGPANCNNVSSPAIAGGYVHYGTTAGYYYVLDAATGRLVRKIDCGEPIFSAPVVHAGRVYFATLGSRVYALTPAGKTCWTWNFVRRVLDFRGDRWSGGDWLRHKQGRVTWRDQFCCPIDIAAYGRYVNEKTNDRHVWCRDARDGSLVWQSEPVLSSVNVVSLGRRFLFSNASGRDGHVLDRQTGKIVSRFNFGYACTRFTLSEP